MFHLSKNTKHVMAFIYKEEEEQMWLAFKQSTKVKSTEKWNKKNYTNITDCDTMHYTTRFDITQTQNRTLLSP